MEELDSKEEQFLKDTLGTFFNKNELTYIQEGLTKLVEILSVKNQKGGNFGLFPKSKKKESKSPMEALIQTLIQKLDEKFPTTQSSTSSRNSSSTSEGFEQRKKDKVAKNEDMRRKIQFDYERKWAENNPNSTFGVEGRSGDRWEKHKAERDKKMLSYMSRNNINTLTDKAAKAYKDNPEDKTLRREYEKSLETQKLKDEQEVEKSHYGKMSSKNDNGIFSEIIIDNFREQVEMESLDLDKLAMSLKVLVLLGTINTKLLHEGIYYFFGESCYTFYFKVLLNLKYPFNDKSVLETFQQSKLVDKFAKILESSLVLGNFEDSYCLYRINSLVSWINSLKDKNFDSKEEKEEEGTLETLFSSSQAGGSASTNISKKINELFYEKYEKNKLKKNALEALKLERVLNDYEKDKKKPKTQIDKMKDIKYGYGIEQKLSVLEDLTEFKNMYVKNLQNSKHFKNLEKNIVKKNKKYFINGFTSLKKLYFETSKYNKINLDNSLELFLQQRSLKNKIINNEINLRRNINSSEKAKKYQYFKKKYEKQLEKYQTSNQKKLTPETYELIKINLINKKNDYNNYIKQLDNDITEAGNKTRKILVKEQKIKSNKNINTNITRKILGLKNIIENYEKSISLKILVFNDILNFTYNEIKYIKNEFDIYKYYSQYLSKGKTNKLLKNFYSIKKFYIDLINKLNKEQSILDSNRVKILDEINIKEQEIEENKNEIQNEIFNLSVLTLNNVEDELVNNYEIQEQCRKILSFTNLVYSQLYSQYLKDKIYKSLYNQSNKKNILYLNNITPSKKIKINNKKLSSVLKEIIKTKKKIHKSKGRIYKYTKKLVSEQPKLKKNLNDYKKLVKTKISKRKRKGLLKKIELKEKVRSQKINLHQNYHKIINSFNDIDNGLNILVKNKILNKKKDKYFYNEKLLKSQNIIINKELKNKLKTINNMVN